MRKYPSYCCQWCGNQIGWTGRFLEWIFGRMHKCPMIPDDDLEVMYLKVVSACLHCDPIPACKRQDGQLEPPWEVIDRVLCERNEARRIAEAYRHVWELCSAAVDETPNYDPLPWQKK